MKTAAVSLLKISSASLALALSPLAANETNCFFSNAGLRIGVDTESQIDLVSYEAFATINTGWSWDLSDRIRLDLDIESAIGGLSGEDKNAVYFRIAPVAEIHYGDSPISVVLSSGPSLYSEDRYDLHDIGGHFQFTSSIGLNWQFDETWTVGYRFQHTSNADTDSPNPGLDMHTVSIAYKF
ncbi:acyloxyacyl hydrolase [Coraliomargarita algicola]|uniref:Acyloxyacyl hydrolase n=1 Tax=Coraliomargarita algicola TaxID=3092156 RepID=A0ABZ0RGR1_9BACT|nr:acyloxyacyl hydrolase [Coraliomargarita sp. J2-16]WPJ95222.1 acyloxyacyl hydrolase [Coraliomargarita sp. J2-16]